MMLNTPYHISKFVVRFLFFYALENNLVLMGNSQHFLLPLGRTETKKGDRHKLYLIW